MGANASGVVRLEGDPGVSLKLRADARSRHLHYTVMQLDRAPKGRNETGYWWHLHDEYDQR